MFTGYVFTSSAGIHLRWMLLTRYIVISILVRKRRVGRRRITWIPRFHLGIIPSDPLYNIAKLSIEVRNHFMDTYIELLQVLVIWTHIDCVNEVSGSKVDERDWWANAAVAHVSYDFLG